LGAGAAPLRELFDIKLGRSISRQAGGRALRVTCLEGLGLAAFRQYFRVDSMAWRIDKALASGADPGYH
jgi:hypothetical protein